jgi:hypothetical protein
MSFQVMQMAGWESGHQQISQATHNYRGLADEDDAGDEGDSMDEGDDRSPDQENMDDSMAYEDDDVDAVVDPPQNQEIEGIKNLDVVSQVSDVSDSGLEIEDGDEPLPDFGSRPDHEAIPVAEAVGLRRSSRTSRVPRRFANSQHCVGTMPVTPPQPGHARPGNARSREIRVRGCRRCRGPMGLPAMSPQTQCRQAATMEEHHAKPIGRPTHAMGTT